MKKFIAFIVVVIVALVVAAQFFLPSFVAKQLEREISNKLNPETIALRIESSPAITMLGGHVDTMRGVLENVKLGHLNFADIHMDVTNLEFNPIALLMNQTMEINQLGNGEIEGTVTASDLQNFMEQSVKGLSIKDVVINSNGIEVIGSVDMGFVKGTANIKGLLEIKNNALVFSPQRFEINGAGIGGLNASVLKPITIYDFAEFPIPVKADRIETMNDEIHLFVNPIAK
ncbi:LmeA family phospholipid-binding protein [Veillonella intestinalis]|uniref:LmeA family phospholipid-binding protein n=1 Tax=Veillonella intestinalis TaxID=2941341 RepID=UPI00203B2ED5|nr:LmeA family phospholipid-binding protein [Veillonella intestinalis]